MKLPFVLLPLLILLFFGQTYYFYPQLPETIASHFDTNGHANGFMSKSGFFAFEGGLVVLMFLISLVLKALLSRMPDSMINVPNKEYWLAPERRPQTLSTFGNFFAWISFLSVALVIAINHVVLTANIAKTDPETVQLWVIAGIFLLCEIGLVVSQLRRFFAKPLA